MQGQQCTPQTRSTATALAVAQSGKQNPSLAKALWSALPCALMPPLYVAVGPKGAAVTADDGISWRVLDTLSYWSADFASPLSGWLVGPGGRITHVRF